MTWDLIADIGGTNARFARLIDGGIQGVETFDTKGSVPLAQIAKAFVQKSEIAPDRAVIAMAGPVRDGTVVLTNAKMANCDTPQSLCETEIAPLTQLGHARLINDFEAAAWAMATVKDADVTALQGDGVLHAGNRLIVGPGTGLGVGTLVQTVTGFQAIPGEGGHVGISPQTIEERQVFRYFKDIWPETEMAPQGTRFEAEAMLSGTGLPKLYRAASASMGLGADLTTAADVLHAAKLNMNNAARVTLNIFRRQLGQVMGDLAITNHAKGGVFIAGGVATKNPWIFDDTFFGGFNAGGRFSEHRKSLRIFLYQNDSFGLIGSANALTFGG
jgi:glucokinase